MKYKGYYVTDINERLPHPLPRFSENLLQSQSSQIQDSSDWMMVEASGPIAYYNVSLERAGMAQDYRKTVGVVLA